MEANPRLGTIAAHMDPTLTLTPLLAAFTVGLLSTLHCVSMCGGIMGALVMGVAPKYREKGGSLFAFALAYNLARVTSYTLAGALVASLGSTLFGWLPVGIGHGVLRIAAGALMLGIGVYLAGWFPQFMRIERVGAPLWRRIEPLTRRLMPVDSLAKAFGFGLLWGWLPCGLVYAVLFTAAGQGSAISGGAFMLAFGLGTLPAVVAAGLLTGRMAHLPRNPYLRQVGGIVVIALALLTLLFPGLGLHTDSDAVCLIPPNPS